jgi:hypothetical protein
MLELPERAGRGSAGANPSARMQRTMSPATTQSVNTALLARIVQRAHAQVMAMIHAANHRPDKKRGDPKVGGHPASCASSMHILGALHLTRATCTTTSPASRTRRRSTTRSTI